jgi:hypothetical protein
MCTRWKNIFHAFVQDIPPRPSPKHHLHRKENDGSYHPGNVEWMTTKERSMRSRLARQGAGNALPRPRRSFGFAQAGRMML